MTYSPSLTNCDSRSKLFDVVIFPELESTVTKPAGSSPIMYLEHMKDIFYGYARLKNSNVVLFKYSHVMASLFTGFYLHH